MLMPKYHTTFVTTTDSSNNNSINQISERYHNVNTKSELLR